MSRIEEEKQGELRKEGMTKLARSLLVTSLVDGDENALKFAGSVSAFSENPLYVEIEGKEVKVTLDTEGGELQVSFAPKTFTLSFIKKEGVETYEAYSPVKEIQLQHLFLLFKLQDGGFVRAVKEYGTIAIEHFDFALYDLK